MPPGTLNEKPLHAELKRWYARPGDGVEVPVDGFVIDIVRDDLLIEIQTGSFSHLRRKLEALLPSHRVHVVHPIAVRTTIVRIDADGTVLGRRRSPKKGAPPDLFAQLVAFPRLIADPSFTLEVVLAEVEQVRRYEAGKAWHRKGWVVVEHRLTDVVDALVLYDPLSLRELIPPTLPREFTTAELAVALRRPRRLAQQMAYCLRETGVVAVVGKQGNAVVYARTPTAPEAATRLAPAPGLGHTG